MVALTLCIPPTNSAAFSGSRCRVLSSPPPASRELSAKPSPLSPPTAMNPASVASADWQIPVRKCTYLISLVVISSRLRLYVTLSVPIHPSSEIAGRDQNPFEQTVQRARLLRSVPLDEVGHGYHGPFRCSCIRQHQSFSSDYANSAVGLCACVEWTRH